MNHTPACLLGGTLSLLLVQQIWSAPLPSPTLTPIPTHRVSPTPTPTPIVYDHFRALAWLNPIEGISYSQALPRDPGFRDIPISANARFRSPFYTFDPKKPVYLLQSTNGTKTVAATLDLSKVPDLPLVLLQFDSTNKLIATIYPDDLTNLPAGAYRLVNFTDQSIDVKLADVETVLEPNASQVSFPHPPTNLLQIEVTQTSTKKRIYSNVFAHNTSVRWILFFVQDAAKQISFLRLSDSSEGAKAPTPTPTPSPTPTPTPAPTPKKKHHKPAASTAD